MLPIACVTLYEDRAQVGRRGTVELESGDQVIEVVISAVASDRSLQVTAEGAEVLDVRVERRTEESPGPDQDVVEAASRELLEVGSALSDALARVEELKAQHAHSERLADLLLQEVTEAADAGRTVETVRLRETLERLRQRSRISLEELQQPTEEAARLEVDARDRQAALEELKRGTTRRKTVAQVRLRCPGGSVHLSMDYLVPAACWRPWHRARLDGERVVFETDACIWQLTGEDWADVELRVSTERASLGTEPPTLQPDRLSTVKVATEVRVEVRDQVQQALGPGGTQAAAEMGGINDGGVPLTLTASNRANIPSDGRPTRVPLARFEAPARRELRCTPELVSAIVLRSLQRNGGPAVLPGPVDLVREQGLVGCTWLDYTASGADFELSWGPEADLRVVRSFREEQKDARMLSKWRQLERVVTLRLSNVGEATHRFTLVERVPVSEVEKVKIEVDLERADAKGFVTWSVELGPGATAERELRYRLKLHSDVTGI